MVLCHSLGALTLYHFYSWEMKSISEPSSAPDASPSVIINKQSLAGFTALALWVACLEEKMLRTLKASWTAVMAVSPHRVSPAAPWLQTVGNKRRRPLFPIAPPPAILSHWVRQDARKEGPVSVLAIALPPPSFWHPFRNRVTRAHDGSPRPASPLSPAPGSCGNRSGLTCPRWPAPARGLCSQRDLLRMWSAPVSPLLPPRPATLEYFLSVVN